MPKFSLDESSGDQDWPGIAGETPIDPSHLIDRTITKRIELEEAEFNNVTKAITRFLGMSPGRLKFDYDWIMNVHKAMFCDVWKWAGEQRTENLNLGCEFPMIGQRLAEFCGEIEFWRTSNHESRLRQSTLIHYRAVSIHPFPNGNGRWSRLLANLWLQKHGEAVVAWPEDIGRVSNIREEYLEALKAADDFDFNPLHDLHARHQRSN